MNQTELQRLAEERIKDAKALIDAGRWEFAYYACGYTIECALKSCVLARMIQTGWVFDEKVKDVRDCRTHEFGQLVRIAGIKHELDARLRESTADSDGFVDNWSTVEGWTVTSRYESKSEAKARRLYDAITAEPNGVLKWIQNYW